jgi:hypothetical protein
LLGLIQGSAFVTNLIVTHPKAFLVNQIDLLGKPWDEFEKIAVSILRQLILIDNNI